MYERPSAGEPISQGDVIDDRPILLLDDPDRATLAEISPDAMLARVIVPTQACDLAQAGSNKVLVAVVIGARALVEKGILKPKTISDSIRRHQVYGWYFLPAGPIPESIVDLREQHSLRRGILERRVAEGKRACRLSTPYREHLAQHFAVTYMRIGLPEPYETEP